MRQAESHSRIGGRKTQQKLKKDTNNLTEELCQQRATTSAEGRI